MKRMAAQVLGMAVFGPVGIVLGPMLFPDNGEEEQPHQKNQKKKKRRKTAKKAEKGRGK